MENERINLEKRLEQTARKGVLSDIKLGGAKIRTLGGQGSPYGASPYQSPSNSPFASRRVGGGAGGVATAAEEGGAGKVEPMEQNPLLLCRVRC